MITIQKLHLTFNHRAFFIFMHLHQHHFPYAKNSHCPTAIHSCAGMIGCKPHQLIHLRWFTVWTKLFRLSLLSPVWSPCTDCWCERNVTPETAWASTWSARTTPLQSSTKSSVLARRRERTGSALCRSNILWDFYVGWRHFPIISVSDTS